MAMETPLLEPKPERAETEKPMKAENTRTAVFAGGCFWCTESDFEKVAGVLEVISGYTGGQIPDPTYEQVCQGTTGHVEAVKVIYDADQISYDDLLEIFWRHVDPTDAGGQFADRGPQYRSAIFYADETQRQQAQASKQRVVRSLRFVKPVVTHILPLGEFFPAEDYHQDFHKHNPTRYNGYRSGSGRDQFLKKIWSTPAPETGTHPASSQTAPDRENGT
jgi:peptide methionine sulfoxide reductase msrA/msrB